MKLFKSKEQNLVHYVTAVTYARTPVFRDAHCCSLFIEALSETRLKNPFKMIGYVLMPDHFHLLAKRLQLSQPLASGQTHAVWLQDFSSIDIWSQKFIRQKLDYIHMNPVRAGLCEHPAKWRWSSYHAYLPHASGDVPIEIDWRWRWAAEEFVGSAVGPDKSGL